MKSRLADLRERMAKAGVDAAVLIHPRDVLYYAGTARPATLLVGPRETTLFVRRGMELARREATVEQIEPGSGFDEVADALAAQRADGTLGAELDVIAADLYLRMQEAFPHWTLVDVSPLVLAQRMVKEHREIEATELAAATADAGHAALRQVLAPGRTELELAAEVEVAMRRAGHEGYQPLRHPGARGGGVLLISGEHLTVRGGHGLVVTGVGLSPASPYGASKRRVRPGDLVMLDIGATRGGYTADESRTYAVGPVTAAQQALFEVALAAEEAVLAALRPGATMPEVYAAAEAVVARGAPPHFAPGDLALPGFAGHGIGLELDEPPVIWGRNEADVAAGMVLAVEIEVDVPATWMMAKVEDTVVVENGGSRLLTAAPREIVEAPLTGT
ncbi:MAG: M24 family metallopeptidase [Anaerolineae bacterium]